jgi:hypothetical protein
MTVKNICASLSLVFALAVGSAESQAAPATYTLSGIASGTLGGTTFSLAPFTITSQADTSQITLLESNVYGVPTTSAVVAISGFSPAAFTIPTTNVANDIVGDAGISALSQGFAILFSSGDPALFSYHLDTSIGPLSGSAGYNPGTAFATSAGDFVIQNIDTATFQATVVPEPPTAALLTIGCVVALVARRR